MIRLESLTHEIDPILYLDNGKGFSESDSFSLQTARKLVCVIAPRGLENIVRIRIDPASSKVRFRIHVTATNRPAALQKQLARESGWQNGPQTQVVAFAKLGEDPLWSGLTDRFTNAKSRRFSIADHYQKVLGLGALQDLRHKSSLGLGERPLISFVVPVFDTSRRYLDDLLASFRIQAPGLAQLVLSDDGSTKAETRDWLQEHTGDSDIVILRNPQNLGIARATNAGIEIADGLWIGLLDHDDVLSPHCVRVIANALHDNPDAEFVYTDELVANGALQPLEYFLKPAYDPVLLSGVNYINHLSLYKSERLRGVGGFREGFQGSQDYDLLLRYLGGLDAERVLHLPYPAYVWRRDGKSYSASFMETATTRARDTLAEHYKRDGIQPPVESAIAPDLHRIRFDAIQKVSRKISVVIPNRDAFPLISRILRDLETKTDYPDLEIIIIDNGTTDKHVHDLYRDHVRGRASSIIKIEPEPFNFSRAVNKGIALASGDLILLLNNDIEVIEPGWLREMACCFAYPGTGIVGARLLYPDRTIQHAGVIVGFGNYAGHWFVGKSQNFPGPMARLHVRQSLSAVTGACMLISRDCLEKTGPFDEKFFAVAYNDIDFCLRAGQQGYRVVWTPFATLIHHESASRGSDEKAANVERFQREKANLEACHATSTFQDRACNPWYTRHRSEPGLALLDHLPKAR